MPEILAAYERDGLQYGAVRILLEAKPIALEFCVDQAGYGALRKVLQPNRLRSPRAYHIDISSLVVSRGKSLADKRPHSASA